MRTAILFPAGVDVEKEIETRNLGKAREVDISAGVALLRQAAKEGRLRCPCGWCLAPLLVSHRGSTLYFAHEPRTAAVCPYYWAQAKELAESRMTPEWRKRLAAAREETESAKAEVGRLRDELKKRPAPTPVLLLPLTQEMLDLRGKVHEPWRVLFVIPESDLLSLAPRLGLSVPPEMPGEGPGPLMQPTPPGSEHVFH